MKISKKYLPNPFWVVIILILVTVVGSLCYERGVEETLSELVKMSGFILKMVGFVLGVVGILVLLVHLLGKYEKWRDGLED